MVIDDAGKISVQETLWCSSSHNKSAFLWPIMAAYGRQLLSGLPLVLFLAYLFFSLTITNAAAMESLSDSEMSSVNAQQGVALSLELRLNTDAAGDPLSGSDGLTYCHGGFFSAINQSDCRFALRLNNESEWILFRGVYGSLKINQLAIDAGKVSQGGTDVSTFDSSRFKDSAGDCLLPGGCTNANVQSLPALVASFKGRSSSNLSYDPVLRKTEGYRDVLQFGLTIQATRLVTGETGFLNTTAGGSFMGLKISDTQDNPGFNNDRAAPRARAFMSGEVFVYGF